MNPQIFKRIQWMTIAVGLVFAIGFGFWKGGASAASVVIGCALGLVNFEALRMLVQRLVRGAVAENAATVGASALLFGLKLIALAVVLFVLMRIERLDVLGIAAGFLSFLVAMVLASVMPASAADTKPSNAPDSKVD